MRLDEQLENYAITAQVAKESRADIARIRALEKAFERLYELRNNGQLADHLEREYRALFREDRSAD